MKISLNQLKSYVEINVPVEELCDRMVMAGFEVESIEKEGENLQNVVVARIEKITPHENSDHLQICQMNIGGDELVQIVTGAQNIAEGDLVPAALHNSYLPGGIHITKGKLRGEKSNGMLCSFAELGLTQNDLPGVFADGIWTLTDANGVEIKARYVVNAAGLFADEVSRSCGAEEFTISPRKGEEFEYMFYFDFEASLADPEVRALMCELVAEGGKFTFLGNYSER